MQSLRLQLTVLQEQMKARERHIERQAAIEAREKGFNRVVDGVTLGQLPKVEAPREKSKLNLLGNLHELMTAWM